jgi:hypothetical protein
MSTLLPRVKEPHLAGRAYPATADALSGAVRELLAAGGPPRPALAALLAPHGPLRHSGRVAARAFAAAGGGWRRAVVLAPTHFAALRGAAVLPLDGYRTPLGTVQIDAEALRTLTRSALVRANPAVFVREPGIEAQLPFLQTVAPGCRVVPILVGALREGEAAALAALLRPLLGTGTLAVVSSDLVHYGRRFGYLPVPPTDRDTVAEAVARLDGDILARLAAGDADGFVRHLAATGATICGRAALEIVLRALAPGVRGERLGYATSLEVTGDHEHVIGYAAVAFSA